MSASFVRVVRRRVAGAFALVLAAVSAFAFCTIHATRMRTKSARELAGLPALAAQLPAADVAFTGGARWLRAPSLEEPGAAQADGIAFPDPEPGGGALVAPRAAYAEGQRP